MAAVSIRDLDDEVRERLKVRAAQHGRSMEAEIRAILTDAVSPPADSTGLAQALLSRFGDLRKRKQSTILLWRVWLWRCLA
jgi:plasmid stability protein